MTTHSEETSEPRRKSAPKLGTLIILLYALAVIAGIAQLAGRKTDAEGNTSSSGLGNLKEAGAVAVVPIEGVITNMGGGLRRSSADQTARRLKALSEQGNVKAVVLRINSPGGSVGAVQELHEEIARLKASGKVVVASIGEVAASGGYYLAAPCDRIFAQPGSITGSIGVIMQSGNVEGLFKKIGMRMETVKSAAHKDIGSPFREMTAEERRLLQSIIDEVYGQFVDAVAQGRKMERSQALALADGRIYSGSQAQKAGLVDEFGNLDTAITRAAELAKIPGKPRVLYEEDPLRKFFSYLSQDSLGGAWSDAALGHFGLRLSYLWEYGG